MNFKTLVNNHYFTVLISAELNIQPSLNSVLLPHRSASAEGGNGGGAEGVGGSQSASDVTSNMTSESTNSANTAHQPGDMA